MMTEAEKTTIRKFAEGAKELRTEAIAIHRKYLTTIGPRGDAYQCFMAEVDHPAPDLGLRSMYRATLLGEVRSDTPS